MLEPERLQGVEQDDIEVPGDAAVLKAVVEHNQLAAEPLDGLAAPDRRSGFSTCGVWGKRRSSSRASSLGRRMRRIGPQSRRAGSRPAGGTYLGRSVGPRARIPG